MFPAEVIIADDGSTEETRLLTDSFRNVFPVPLLHVWHEDQGFRAAAIRNRAIWQSSGDYLIFSDGDLFFHRLFIEDFTRNAADGYALIGSRVFLSEKATKRRLESGDTRQVLPFFSGDIELNRLNSIRCPLAGRYLKPVKFSENLRGGLLGVYKKDIEGVNGWNEDFSGWGLEDTELVARLFHYGVYFRKIKFQAIVYHLWHRLQKRDYLVQNRLLLEKTLSEKLTACPRGLSLLI